MKLDKAWLVVVMGIACLQLTACGQAVPAATETEAKPARVEHLEGAEPTRVTLSEEAASRLDIQTDTATDVTIDGAQLKAIPYAAIIYDTEGHTWTYTNPEPLTFFRHPVTVEHIVGDQVILSEGLASNIRVVTVGAEELYGSESEFQEE